MDGAVIISYGSFALHAGVSVTSALGNEPEMSDPRLKFCARTKACSSVAYCDHDVLVWFVLLTAATSITTIMFLL